MSGDMHVKLFLDLVNRLSPGAKVAARDIKSIKQAAGELKREKGGEALAAGLNKVAPAGRKAAGEIRAVKAEARQLAGERGPQHLAGGLDKAAGSARRLRRELDATKRSQRDFVRNAPLGAAAIGMRAHDRKGRGGGPAGSDGGAGGGGFGLGAAAAAAGRSALMPLAAAYGGYRAVSLAARSTVGQAISFEKAMADVRKKVDGMDDPAQLAAMEKSISKWAITYGRSREEVAALVAEAGAGGVSRADMPEFARINLAASTAWDVSASQAGNALAKIRAATQWSNKELEVFVDKVNALADAGSAKEMDVVDMFQRAGAAAKAAGVEFDTSLAFLTAMNNVAIAPEVASRGFAAFASTLRIASDKPKRVAEGLKMLGLSTKSVEKGMKTNATATMMMVLEKLEAHADKAAVAVKVFGQEWWDEVARAGQALPEIRKALAIVRDPKKYTGSAMGNLNIELSTSAKHLEQLKALVGDVGDRLGRWALPGINASIKLLIDGLNELDRRSEQRQQASAINEKAEGDRLFTAEERARMADDPSVAAEAARRRDRAADDIARNSNIREKALSDAERTRLESRVATLTAQEAALQEQIDAIKGRSRDSAATAGPIAEIERKQIALRRQRDTVNEALKRSKPSPQGAADRGDREAERAKLVQQRGRIADIQSRLAEAEARLQRLDTLAASQSNPANRKGFLSDRTPYLRDQAKGLYDLRYLVAPQAAAAGNFRARPGGVQGKGWKDSKNANWAPGAPIPATGSGQTSFGINGGAGVGKGGWGKSGAAWAEKVRNDLDIDLGDGAMTMMERLAGSIESGGARAAAAAGAVKDNVMSALMGIDATSAGLAIGQTLAAGIEAGGGPAIAAARALGAKAKAAAESGASGGGGRRTLGGALHDGVD